MPAYWLVLRLIALWILVPVFVLIAAPIEWQNSPGANAIAFAIRQLWNLLMAQVFSASVITMVFAIMQRTHNFTVGIHGNSLRLLPSAARTHA